MKNKRTKPKGWDCNFAQWKRRYHKSRFIKARKRYCLQVLAEWIDPAVPKQVRIDFFYSICEERPTPAKERNYK